MLIHKLNKNITPKKYRLNTRLIKNSVINTAKSQP